MTGIGITDLVMLSVLSDLPTTKSQVDYLVTLIIFFHTTDNKFKGNKTVKEKSLSATGVYSSVLRWFWEKLRLNIADMPL